MASGEADGSLHFGIFPRYHVASRRNELSFVHGAKLLGRVKDRACRFVYGRGGFGDESRDELGEVSCAER
jgi:hypothetical protein